MMEMEMEMMEVNMEMEMMEIMEMMKMEIGMMEMVN